MRAPNNIHITPYMCVDAMACRPIKECDANRANEYLSLLLQNPPHSGNFVWVYMCVSLSLSFAFIEMSNEIRFVCPI